MTDQLRQLDATAVAPVRTPARGPRLVVPEGWVIDEAAYDRLMRQLDGAPADVAGVVAEVGDLPPGASYRVHAEWRSLEPLSAVVEQRSTSVQGAVLVRPGVGFQLRGDVIDVGAGPLLVDSGAHVHDPWRPVAPLAVATELGRPPFPRRPVVVFVAHEGDEDLADWARQLVNRLVRRDIEARLALPDVAEGLHLTRPCLPREESIRALAPDVVVALDDAAAADAPRWCGADRSTVIVELDDDVSMTTQLVSWQVGHSSGRVRARISPRVDAPSLAALVRRLCAGPHPMPPSDGAVPGPTRVAVRAPADGSATTQTVPTRARAVVVVTGELDPPVARRVDGLCDHLAAASAEVAVAPLDGGVPASAHAADLLLVIGVDGSELLDELVSTRRDAGRPTVVDVGPGDLELHTSNSDTTPSLNPRVADLAIACGLATSPGGAVHRALRDLEVRSHQLPTLLNRTRAAALREARAIAGFEAQSDVLVGWHVGSVATPVPDWFEVVAAAISSVLTDRTGLLVELVGDPARVPGSLRGQDRVTIASVEPGPEVLVRWAAHLWTPLVVAGSVVDDLGGLVDVSSAGVPSVMPAAARGAIDGHVAPELVVADTERPEQWVTALHALLDDETLRAHRARDTFFHSRAVYGSVASRAVVNRFLGWVRHQGAA